MNDTKATIKAENYGEVLAAINDMELVSFEDDGGYQGEYKVVLKEGDRLLYYFGSYGSCSGCDWIEDVKDWDTGEIPYKEALDYCAGIKPMYIVPDSMPLAFKSEEYEGFELKQVLKSGGEHVTPNTPN
jgi:hypothetical protein